MKKVESALSDLQRLGFVSLDDNGSITRVKDSIHLSKDAPIYFPHYKLLRLAALERQEKIMRDVGYGFSVIFSSNEQVRETLQNEFMKFIQSTKDMVDQSDVEHVYQMNFDLIPWSKAAGV